MWIRAAKRDDAGDLTHIFRAARSEAYRGAIPDDVLDWMLDAYGDAEWRAKLDRLLASGRDPLTGGRHLDLAIDAGESAGLVEFGALEGAAPAEFAVFSLFVDPDRKGRGIGRALLAHAERTLHAGGAGHAELWTLEANTRARRIYTAAGWRADGARPETVFGPGTLIEVRFRKSLQAVTR